MRRFYLIVFVVLAVRCAGISGNSDGSVQLESINRDSVLLRFTSSPRGAEAMVACGTETRRVVTPGTARLPIHGVCVVTFSKDGYEDEVTEFEPAAFAHPSVLNDDPSCNDAGVWCSDDVSLSGMVFGSIFFGTSGLIARAFDRVRHGRGEIGAVLLPVSQAGSDSAPPGG